jgi:hypothetical protein
MVKKIVAYHNKYKKIMPVFKGDFGKMSLVIG